MLPQLLLRRALPRTSKARMNRRARLHEETEDKNKAKKKETSRGDNETVTTAGWSAMSDSTGPGDGTKMEFFSHPSGDEGDDGSSSSETNSCTDESSFADKSNCQFRITVGNGAGKKKPSNVDHEESGSDTTTTILIDENGDELFSYYSFKHSTLQASSVSKQLKMLKDLKLSSNGTSEGVEEIEVEVEKKQGDSGVFQQQRKPKKEVAKLQPPNNMRANKSSVFPKVTTHLPPPPPPRAILGSTQRSTRTVEKLGAVDESDDTVFDVFDGLEEDSVPPGTTRETEFSLSPTKTAPTKRKSNEDTECICLEEDEDTVFDQLALLLLGEEEAEEEMKEENEDGDSGSDDGPSSMADTVPTQLPSMSSTVVSSRKKVSFQLPQKTKSEDEAWNLEKEQRRQEKKLRKERRAAKKKQKRKQNIMAERRARTIEQFDDDEGSQISNISRYYQERNRAFLDEKQEEEVAAVVLHEYEGNPYKKYSSYADAPPPPPPPPPPSKMSRRARNRQTLYNHRRLSASARLNESPSDEASSALGPPAVFHPNHKLFNQEPLASRNGDADLPFLELVGEPAYSRNEDDNFLVEQQYMKPSCVEISEKEQTQHQQNPGKIATPMSSLTTRSRRDWAISRSSTSRFDNTSSGKNESRDDADIQLKEQEEQAKKSLETINSATLRYQKMSRSKHGNKTKQPSPTPMGTGANSSNKHVSGNEMNEDDDDLVSDMTQMYNDVVGAINDIGSDVFWAFTDNLPEEEPMRYLSKPKDQKHEQPEKQEQQPQQQQDAQEQQGESSQPAMAPKKAQQPKSPPSKAPIPNEKKTSADHGPDDEELPSEKVRARLGKLNEVPTPMPRTHQRMLV